MVTYDLLQALQLKKTTRTPIWIKRQAGRYLPEYRLLRQQAKDFMQFCRTPELAIAATLQPIARFDLDAAIIFSDILTVPDAMGLKVKFIEQEGPRFLKTIQSATDIEDLLPPDATLDNLKYVFKAVKGAKQELANKVPLFGFAGSPWTVATYMVEGGSSKSFSVIKKMLFANPELLEQLLTKIASATTLYLKGQIEAGCDAIMIFDTWGGVLAKSEYLKFSLAYMQQIVQGLSQYQVPVILFTKNGGRYIQEMMATQCHGIGLDWTANWASVISEAQGKVALQGNLDPSVLYGSEALIKAKVEEIFAEVGSYPGFIFNLGHGIHPDTNPDKVKFLVDLVHSL